MEQANPNDETRTVADTDLRIALELEFAGLDEAAAAQAIARATGGRAAQADGNAWRCDTAAFGTCEVDLDTRFGEVIDTFAGGPARDLARRLAPVEVVTDPFPIPNLPQFDHVLRALRDAGAVGSHDGFFLGFGLHLNIEIASDDARFLGRRLAAYALIEDHLRARDPIDVSRRVLPFVSPYPYAMIDALAAELPETRDDLVAFYLSHAPSRDHGLDLLPILAAFDHDRVAETAEGMTAIKPRPAFHFRLPDCRVDEPAWSVMEAWQLWSTVETVAEDFAVLDRLRQARLDWAKRPASLRAPWFRVVEEVLERSERERS